MGVLDRFEKGIERAVNGAFAKAFRSEVQPVEIASALRRECDDHAAIVARDRTIAPNFFVVELGPADHERLGQWEEALGDELGAVVADHARQQRYHLAGPVSVAFEQADDLDTGLFRVRSRTTKRDSPTGRRAAGPPAGAAEGPSAPGSDVPGLGEGSTGRRAAPPPPAQVGWSQPLPEVPGASVPEGHTAAGSQAGSSDERDAAGHAAAPRSRFQPSLDLDGRTLPINRPVTVIGRGSDADVMLDDSGVSRRHAEIHIVDGRARIIDLGSTNGTHVDGSKNPVAGLHDGSVITIGRTRMIFHTGESPSSGANGPDGPW